MIFKPLDQELVKKLLEPYQNESILLKEKRDSDEFFKRTSCIRCNGPVQPILNVAQPFREGQLIPNCIAKCTQCECEFEPYTKIEIAAPKNFDSNLV